MVTPLSRPDLTSGSREGSWFVFHLRLFIRVRGEDGVYPHITHGCLHTSVSLSSKIRVYKSLIIRVF